MATRTLEALAVLASGSNLATGAASASVAIPNNASGNKARFVRILATADCYVKAGLAGLTAAAGDLYVGAGPAGREILNVHGATHIAAIQVDAAGTLNIVPLED